MKQKLYITGLIAILVTITGAILKENHLPGAAILLISGIAALLLIFLPLSFSEHFRAYGSRITLPLYLIAWVTCLVIFVAMLFNLLQWPGARILVLIAIPFPIVVFLPVYLYVTSRIDDHGNYKIAYILLLLTGLSVLNSLLALDVSKNRIKDTLVLSSNYIRFDESLGGAERFLVVETRNPEYRKLLDTIDSTVRLIEICQERILEKAGMTVEEWLLDPALADMHSMNAAREVMFSGEKPVPAVRLEENLNTIVNLLRQITVFGDLAGVSPVLLGYGAPGYTGSQWRTMMFADNHLSWALVYLESLKVNIRMLKISTTLKAY